MIKRFRAAPCLAAFASLFILALSLFTATAWAQSKIVRVINPYPPGGTADIIMRVVADQVSKTQGITFVIENRPGGGTIIGSEAVSRAAPDGATLLINAVAMYIGPQLRKMSFEPLSSLVPICGLIQSPQLFVVNKASPFHTLGDFVAAARANPGRLTFSNTGPATAPHMAFESFKRAANISVTYVPYPGNVPTVNAVLGGHVTAGAANYADWVGHLQGGTARALATLTPTRIQPLPELPTAGEAGYKEFEYLTWFGMFAPAKTPDSTIAQLVDWFAAARQAPEVSAKLNVQGLYAMSECGADFAAMVRRESDHYGRVIREANIQAE
jgi:tripartite-type tricarboxylate transporter receptor subunit TctC